MLKFLRVQKNHLTVQRVIHYMEKQTLLKQNSDEVYNYLDENAI